MKNSTKHTGRLLGAGLILGIALLAACTPGYPATVCHAAGGGSNPYEEIAVTGPDASVHLGHPNDFGPVPAGGCPASLVPVTNGKIAICHATSSKTNPYNEINVSVAGLNGHGNHEGDLIPVPEEGCPTGPAPAATNVGNNDGKVTICHHTGSSKNPYNLITVSVNGLNGHNNHAGDIIPAPAAGCPAQ